MTRNESGIIVPGWAMPVVLLLAMSGVGLYVQTTSIIEAQKLIATQASLEDQKFDVIRADKALHAKRSIERLNALEAAREQHEIELQLIKKDLSIIKEVAIEANKNAGRNNRLMIRIATKLEVPTPEIE